MTLCPSDGAFFGLLLAAVTLQVDWSRAEIQQDLDASLRGLQKVLWLPKFSLAIKSLAPYWKDSVALHVAAVHNLNVPSNAVVINDLAPLLIVRQPALPSLLLKLVLLQIADLEPVDVAEPVRISVCADDGFSREMIATPRPTEMLAPLVRGCMELKDAW